VPYGEILTRILHDFDVSLNEKDATQPMKTDYFKESFLNMCGLKRENGIRWLGTKENRRRDEEEGDSEESEEDKSESDEKEEDASPRESTPAATKRESSELVDDFYDVVDSSTASDKVKDAPGGDTQPAV
ncbi:hypothetical protein Dimus_013476, partial [Dionaea muscipula]